MYICIYIYVYVYVYVYIPIKYPKCKNFREQNSELIIEIGSIVKSFFVFIYMLLLRPSSCSIRRKTMRKNHDMVT